MKPEVGNSIWRLPNRKRFVYQLIKLMTCYRNSNGNIRVHDNEKLTDFTAETAEERNNEEFEN